MENKETNSQEPPQDLNDPILTQTKSIRKYGMLTAGIQTLLIFLLIAAIVVLAVKINHDEAANRDSQCFFYSTIGGIPLPAKPVPTKRNVEIVVSARVAFAGLHCTIHIDPPNDVLINAAKKFGIRVPR